MSICYRFTDFLRFSKTSSKKKISESNYKKYYVYVIIYILSVTCIHIISNAPLILLLQILKNL
jgi:hypothetical protein